MRARMQGGGSGLVQGLSAAATSRTRYEAWEAETAGGEEPWVRQKKHTSTGGDHQSMQRLKAGASGMCARGAWQLAQLGNLVAKPWHLC